MDIVDHHGILNSFHDPNRLLIEGVGGSVLCASLCELLRRVVRYCTSSSPKRLRSHIDVTTFEVVLVREAGDNIGRVAERGFFQVNSLSNRLLVEVRGFEPLTPCMPCKCSTS